MLSKTIIALLLALSFALPGRVPHAGEPAASGPPQRKAAPSTGAKEVVSYINIPVRLTSAGMSDVINKMVPKSLSAKGMEGSKMAGVEYDATVTVKNRFAAVAANNGVNIKAVLHGKGVMKVYATMIRILQEHPSGDIAVDVNAKVDMGAKWNPTAKLDVKYKWQKKPKIIWNTFSISSFIDPMIDKEIAKLKKDMPKNLKPVGQDIKKAMGGLWTNLQDPISLPGVMGSPLWMSVTPIAISMETPRSQGKDLLLNIGIQAKIKITAKKAAPAKKTALPDLLKKKLSKSGFRLSVPAHIPYELLRGELAKMYKKPQELKSGKNVLVKINFGEWEVYPSHPTLVVGVRITVEIPGLAAKEGGKIYFQAEPVYDAKTGMLSFKNVSFTPEADNYLVANVSAMFKDELAALFEQNAVYDLGKMMADPIANVNRFLTTDLMRDIRKSAGGKDKNLQALLNSVKAAGGVKKVDSVSFALGDKDLIVHPILSGALSLELAPALK